MFGLHDRLMIARNEPGPIQPQTESDLLVELAPHLEDFVGDLFSIADEVRALQARHHELLRWQRRCEDAIPELETALALNPNWTNSLDSLAWCKPMTGSIAEAIPLEEQAIRLSSRDPAIGNYYTRTGLVHLLQSRIDEAIVWFEKARSAIRKISELVPTSLLFMLSRARASAPPPSAPKPADWSPTVVIRASRAWGPPEPSAAPGMGGAEGRRPVRSHILRRPAQGWHAGGVNTRPRLSLAVV